MHEELSVTCDNKPPVAMQASDLACRHGNMHILKSTKTEFSSKQCACSGGMLC